MSERYVNHYIEILTSTMTDAVIRNISLQSNCKVNEEVIVDIGKKNEELKSVIENQNKKISDLTAEITTLNRSNAEIESLKLQSNNAETFRNELKRERESHNQTKTSMKTELNNLQKIIDELNEQIVTLKTPMKRKKQEKVEQNSVSEGTLKDGGSF